MVMTKIAGSPDRSSAKPGMAFFSGTGPKGTTCRTCKFCGYMRKAAFSENLRKVNACEKFHSMTGRHGPDVEEQYESCKYYEPVKPSARRKGLP